ncbi:MAG: serine/threonine protein kinase [Phycisphaerales bacterium]|nr:serine/threonine protein kinase [Phycisphaerales bacterium]
MSLFVGLGARDQSSIGVEYGGQKGSAMSHVDYRSLIFDDVKVGKYRFRKRIGKGGHAAVFLAEELFDNSPIRKVAIKVFAGDFENRSAFAEMRSDYEQDLRPLVELASDQTIVQYYATDVYDIYVSSGNTVYAKHSDDEEISSEYSALTSLFLVMEFADGGALGPNAPHDSVYRRERIISGADRSFLDHLIAVCKGLHAAHNRGIVHRDIKPQNLLYFKSDNRVKITDFGVAQHLHKPSFGVVGTPPYMSPESFEAGGADNPARDIYALGCTFFEIVTGQLAFPIPSDGTRTQTARRDILELYHQIHLQTPRPDAVVSAPDVISVAFSGIIKRMMSVKTEDRPSLDEVIDVLRNEKRGVDDFPTAIVKVSQDVALPTEPVFHHGDNINPRFRFDRLKEHLYFIFIRMSSRTVAKMRILFWFLETYFKDSFSIYEVFGPYDFMIRIWSNPAKATVQNFCENLVSNILDGVQKNLQVMACDDVMYLGGKTTDYAYSQKLDTNEVLAKLYDVQSHNSTTAREWLNRKKIYVRKKRESFKGQRVKCFCRVTIRADQVSAVERQSQYLLLTKTIQDALQDDLAKLEASVYKRLHKPLDWIDHDRCDFIIKYVAPQHTDAVKIPGLILADLEGHAFMTSTLLVTKRYYVESDRVRPQ